MSLNALKEVYFVEMKWKMNTEFFFKTNILFTLVIHDKNTLATEIMSL